MAYRELQLLAVLIAAFTPISHARVPQRIIDGGKASIHDFPYQVLLVKHSPSGEYTICGGVIIDSRHILTAAHCLYMKDGFSLLPLNSLIVVTGIDDSTAPPIERFFGVSNAVQYPNPNHNETGEFEHDLAILLLRRQISFDDRQIPAVFPTQDIAVGTKVIAIGWGDRGVNAENSPPYLYKLNSTVISLTTCRSWVPSWNVDSNAICTWSENRGAPCTGDSGSPVSFDGVVVGIISAGACDSDYPAVSVNVYHYLSWIGRIILVQDW